MKPAPFALIPLCAALALAASTALAASAPGAPGASPVWGPSQKSFLGTSTSSASRVYFTGYRGIVSEVFYPVVDTVNTVDLQFLVGDTARTFVDEEKLQAYSVIPPNSRSMRWQATTYHNGHNWRLRKVVFTDPERSALVMRTTFEALNGKTVGDFNLYLLHNPSMDNSGAGDNSRNVSYAGRTMLVASQNQRASALAVSQPWKTQGGVSMTSHGFVGVSDGWTDLLGGGADKTMSWSYDSAYGGNVAQMGWLDLAAASGATSVSFDVVLGFGASETEAAATTAATLGSDLAAMQTAYDAGWQGYTATLDNQGGSADNQYYMAAMALKTIQDKSNGAMIAGLGTPWGDSNGDGNNGGYHLVWPRDLFKFANALLTAGDVATARDVTLYLFNTLRQGSDCGVAEYNAAGCPQGYSRVGRFPQNAWVSGWQYWQGTQMDQQGMPIVLAWRTYQKGDASVKSTINALWPKIKTTADYLANTGPWTQQERWEEQAGYSPSTIAAEIAGLNAAAQFARLNGDTASAARYLAAADSWQQKVSAWTFTRSGPFGDGRYFVRINPSTPSGAGSGPQRYDPLYGPDAAINVQDKNGGGARDQRRVIDGGFLELVRLGVKRANDPDIVDTLAEYDAVLKQTVAGKGDAWFRYNYDGYGEHNDGRNFDGSGRGRLWPIFTAERGMYQIAATGLGSSGSAYLGTVKAFADGQGFIPEQVWNNSALVGGDWDTTLPAGYTAGRPTKSMGPLNWAMGEYISLLASIQAGRVVDIPSETCSRYYACVVQPVAGQVGVDIAASAATVPGQQVYVTGNAGALGAWNTDLGIPLDATSYPSWKNHVNLPANAAIQYKYYRKNADGSVSWENLPGGGNRSFNTGSGGNVSWNDSVSW